MSQAFLFTAESRNAKTGPIAVTTSPREFCPDTCPLKKSGCYAAQSNLGYIWRALSTTTAGQAFKNGRSQIGTVTWQTLVAAVTDLSPDTLWRHNQAGDLPGDGAAIDRVKLSELVVANSGKRGFTYSHYDVLGSAHNRDAIADANKRGFTINLSGNSLSHADKLADTGAGPVVTLLAADQTGKRDIATPAGRRVVVCPATYRDDVTCKSCGLCQRQSRNVIVGFPAHGAAKKAASQIATAN
jgi:hypothetical protein